MQVSVESGEGLEKRMQVELPVERVDDAVNEKLRSLSRTVRLDGFRPGKIPMRVLKQRFGPQVKSEVYSDLIKDTFHKAVAAEELRLAGEPHIEVSEDGDKGVFSYTATFEVIPDVQLAVMDEVVVRKPVSSVAPADVDAMIEKLRRQRTVWKEVERPAEDGDTVRMDFVGRMDGEVFEGGSGKDVPLVLGSGAMIDGFESGLLGVSAGDERTLELRFPENYQAQHLAGKEVEFVVTVNSVAAPEIPEVDEDFVKALGVEAGTEEALREEVTRNMNRELKQKLSAQTKERVMDKLLEINVFDIPEALVTQEAEALKEQAEQEMAKSGNRSTLDLPLKIFTSQARRRVKLGLIIGEIVKQQQLQVDESRVDEVIEEAAQSYETPQEVIDWYRDNPESRAGVENKVLEDQVVEWLLEQMQVEEETLSFDEIMGNDEAGK